MGFLVVKNDKAFGDIDAEQFPDCMRFCREIINTNRIMHVYVVLPEETAICIEYLSKKGDWFSIYESFNNKSDCDYRFAEIGRILKEEQK